MENKKFLDNEFKNLKKEIDDINNVIKDGYFKITWEWCDENNGAVLFNLIAIDNQNEETFIDSFDLKTIKQIYKLFLNTNMIKK